MTEKFIVNNILEQLEDFADIDISIYWNAARGYLPKKIKCLIIAESPPAFIGDKPTAYFYFSDCPKADSLFYTIIKALFDIDYQKNIKSRISLLKRFRNEGYFLTDSVDYPINKYRNGDKIPNQIRENIINQHLNLFLQKIKCFERFGYINKETKVILIKKTVFNQLKNCYNNVLNESPIQFPTYVKDKLVIQEIRELLGINFD